MGLIEGAQTGDIKIQVVFPLLSRSWLPPNREGTPTSTKAHTGSLIGQTKKLLQFGSNLTVLAFSSLYG